MASLAIVQPASQTIVRGTAIDVTREYSDPQVDATNNVKLRFVVVVPVTVDGRLQEKHVSVEMIKRTIEGTVRKESNVEVRGKFNDRGVLRADRITDLNTGATIGYDSPSPRFRNGTRLKVRGDAIWVEEKRSGHPGEAIRKQKIRFAIRVVGPGQRFAEGELVSVEIVKRRINGLVRSGKTVDVNGQWTKRNVLRADSVTDLETGAIIK